MTILHYNFIVFKLFAECVVVKEIKSASERNARWRGPIRATRHLDGRAREIACNIRDTRDRETRDARDIAFPVEFRFVSFRSVRHPAHTTDVTPSCH